MRTMFFKGKNVDFDKVRIVILTLLKSGVLSVHTKFSDILSDIVKYENLTIEVLQTNNGSLELFYFKLIKSKEK